MNDIMQKIENLLSAYEKGLSDKGILYSVSKKYFEIKAHSTSFRHHDTLEIFLRHLALKRENKSFHHQRNRHHVAVISFYPIDKKLLKKHECKEYAYFIYEITRLEEGFAPKERKYKEEKILKKIEKRIRRILKSAEKKSAVEICKETKLDIIRCFFLRVYGYKKTVAGIDRDMFDIAFTAVFLILGLIVLLFFFFLT